MWRFISGTPAGARKNRCIFDVGWNGREATDYRTLRK